MGSRRPALLLALLAGPWLLLPAAQASTADPQQGWWSATGQAAPVAAPLPAGPTGPLDVPEDGLLVQGSAQTAMAYAAVLFEVPAGTAVGGLTLQVAEGSATTPTSGLKACPLVPPAFEPAQGGSLDDAPAYDCGRSADATLDGTAWTLDASTLVSGGKLAVALVPAAEGTRIALQRVTGDALATSGTPTTTSAPPAAGSGTPGERPTDAGTGGGTGEGTGTDVSPGLQAEVDAPPAVGGDDGSGGTTGPFADVPVEAPALAEVSEPAPDGGVLAPADGAEQPAAAEPFVETTSEQVPVALGTSSGGGSGRALVVLLSGALALAAALWAFAGDAAGREQLLDPAASPST